MVFGMQEQGGSTNELLQQLLSGGGTNIPRITPPAQQPQSSGLGQLLGLGSQAGQLGGGLSGIFGNGFQGQDIMQLMKLLTSVGGIGATGGASLGLGGIGGI